MKENEDILKLLKSNIEIEEVLLRNFINLSENELEMIRLWRNSPEVKRWMYNNKSISKEEHFRFVENLKKDTKNFYYLVSKDKMNIGVIDLLRLDPINKNAYFGIYTNPEIKEKGLGSSLGKTILKLAFEILNLQTLKLEVFETNSRALQLYKKLSFKEEGRLREFVFRDGKWIDVIIMGMTQEEYKNAKCKNSK